MESSSDKSSKLKLIIDPAKLEKSLFFLIGLISFKNSSPYTCIYFPFSSNPSLFSVASLQFWCPFFEQIMHLIFELSSFFHSSSSDG